MEHLVGKDGVRYAAQQLRQVCDRGEQYKEACVFLVPDGGIQESLAYADKGDNYSDPVQRVAPYRDIIMTSDGVCTG
jgi:hypothetical protein